MSYGNFVTNFGIISEQVVQDILNECSRAHQKHGEQSMLYGSDGRSLRILMEEVGEVARAMNELALNNIDPPEYGDQLRAELVQVAAMAATWLAKLDSPRRNALDYNMENI